MYKRVLSWNLRFQAELSDYTQTKSSSKHMNYNIMKHSYTDEYQVLSSYNLYNIKHIFQHTNIYKS